MRIATRLRISAAATVAAVVILVPVFYWAFSAYREAQSGNDLVEAIQRNFTERASFRDQYFLYREDRARMQWEESKVQSDQLLRSAKSRFQDEADQQAVQRIRRAVEETGIVFHRIVDNSQSLKSATGNREVFEELDKRLYSQLLLKAADVRDAISAIQSSSAMQEQQAYRRFTMISYVLALLLAFIIVLNAVQIGGLIRRRLLALHDGANRVVNGNFAHRIESDGRDEFSEIAGAINLMMDTLARDFTKLREASDALEASARALERSNTELEQFAYIASHDLQEPLRMVAGYVQLLDERLVDKLDAETRKFMTYAVDGALRMQVLIEDILAYSRVTTQGAPLSPVDSAQALQDALAALASRIAETGAVVDTQSLPVVMADRTQLGQVFQNLIGNAIKFCKDRTPHVRVEARREGPWWRFSVIDNGIGIAPEYRAQLFVIFKRLHTRREYPGTGIGLAICKRIIQRHGGDIGIESAPDGGSIFWFTLPEEKSL